MRPVEGQPGVWVCERHGLFARVEEPEKAAALERGDPMPLHDGGAGVMVRSGDERAGGVLLYYRAA
ncbi:MAG: hypothetical protein M3R06_08610, partial [Chloroflexota bacterium]|nr:hypothetical protein [Chloroflexota bacterium]